MSTSQKNALHALDGVAKRGSTPTVAGAAAMDFTSPQRRRVLTSFLAGATLLMGSGLAQAQQAWPTRPVKLVVPFPPGGGSDTVARIVARYLAERLGQPVVVENRAGGGGTVGVASALNSPADGYTLIWCSPAAQYLAPPDLPYKPFEDLVPVSLTVEATYLLVTAPNSGIDNLAELLKLGRERPDYLNYATAGANGHGRLMGEYMAMLAGDGFRMTAIPFAGEGPAVVGIMSGEVQVGFISSAASLPQVQAGTLRAIGNTSTQEFPGIPASIPPIADTLPGYDVTAINYISMRQGTPEAIVQQASEALQAVLAMPEVREQIARLGVIARGSSPQALGERVKSEYEQWHEVRVRAGLPTP